MSCSLQQVHLVSEIEKREDSVTSCWVEVRDRSKFNEEDTSEKEKKVKFERVFNWEKMTSFFELFGSILDYKWYQRAHAKTGDETVVSQRSKIDGNEDTKWIMLTNKTLVKMKRPEREGRIKEQTNPSIRWYQEVESWDMRWEKIKYLNCHRKWINLKRSVNRSALYNIDYDGCNSKYFWPSLSKIWHFCKSLVFIIHKGRSPQNGTVISGGCQIKVTSFWWLFWAFWDD